MEEFDRIVDRRNTYSTKWDRYGDRDVLPFWVADTDFRTPDFILARIRERLDHGPLGYTAVPQALNGAVRAWLARSCDWHVQENWLVWLPGVVPGLNLACRAVGEAGDRVMMNVPVYYPFRSVPWNGGRHGTEVPLRPIGARGQRWEMDFDAMEGAVSSNTRLFLFCNPQNPTGRIYSAAELERLARFCMLHDLVVCSDEIHCSLRLDPGKPHIPLASISTAMAERSITLMAPSKTYNMPGLGCAFAVIPNAALRSRFLGARAGLVPSPGTLALAAATAAYEDRSSWVERLNRYLASNRDRLATCVASLPGVSMAHVEATFLAWIDVQSLQLEDAGRYFERHGLGLSDGTQFGGRGFVRFNFGCPRATLDEGLLRLARAVRTRASELGIPG
jgi:cysteine-S-conjugate beta-lyase